MPAKAVVPLNTLRPMEEFWVGITVKVQGPV